MYSPRSYISLHLIFFWSHLHSKLQMNAIVFLTTTFHSIHLSCNLFYSRDHRSKSLQGVGPHPGLQVILPGQQWVCDEMGEAALFLQGADTRFQAMLGGNANLAILNLGFFFSRKINNSELHMKLTFETLQSNQSTWWAQPWPVC